MLLSITSWIATSLPTGATLTHPAGSAWAQRVPQLTLKPLTGSTPRGKGWSALAIPAGQGSGFLDSVSCPTPTFCMAVGDDESASDAFAWVLSDERWIITQPVVTEHGGRPDAIALTHVSCGSPVSCMAIGTYKTHQPYSITGPLAEWWNGKSWRVVLFPGISTTGTQTPGTVSCPTAKFCATVLFKGSLSNGALAIAITGVFTWHPGAVQWTILPSDLNGSVPSALACESARRCTLVSMQGSLTTKAFTMSGPDVVSTWDGKAWKSTPSSLAAAIGAWACVPASMTCLGAGWPTDVPGHGPMQFVSVKGSAMTTVPGPAGTGVSTSFLGASCRSPSWCVMTGVRTTTTAGSSPVVASWNGKQWTASALPQPANAAKSALVAIACATRTRCVAVGTQVRTSGPGIPLVERWG
jgi:hypothetical protein